MRSVPKVGTRVISPRFRGIGQIVRVRALRFEGVVKWPSGLITSLPFEEIDLLPEEAPTVSPTTAETRSK